MSASPFAAIPPTARNHFRVSFYAATFHLIAHLRALAEAGSVVLDELFERHPFLTGYLNELSEYLPQELRWQQAPPWWEDAMRAWEAGAHNHLPLVALDATGIDFTERLALVVSGLVEEDARFGSVFAELQRPLNQRRPTLETVASIVGVGSDAWSVRDALCSRGLVETVAGSGPRSEETVVVPLDLWTVLRGTPSGQPLPWADIVTAPHLHALDDLVLPEDTQRQVRRLSAALVEGPTRLVVARGPRSSGRRRLLGALARSAGRGALFVDAERLDEPAWRRLGSLSAALGVMPVVSYDLAPGQTAQVPSMPGLIWHAGIVVGTEGGLAGRPLETAARLHIPPAGPQERRIHWRTHLPEVADGDLDVIADRFHLPSGHIRRVAGRARNAARLEGRTLVNASDVRRACQDLGRERLDTLAQRLDPPGERTRLVVDEAMREHLLALESRCRHREHVLKHVGTGFGASAGPGVRVLMTGPSGTGKTLACSLLAAALGTDLYRVDLSAIVDKYVGETEKNLHRILSTAEELDVVLLIDEGDSLLGNRTQVRTANDRFANLETNYLLQRLENYQGIVLVTTNAPESIDPAFQRRMDVVLNLVEPGPAQRWEIWNLHLPPGHEVGAAHLEEVSARAEMTGGQIRNAAMHAAFLALHEGCPVGDRHLDRAVAVEYGKAGAVSPFQRGGGWRRRRSETFLEALP
ncbi:MAG: AAA family ATPase [Hyphomicrobiales bacterium]|nr:MAG: AAA family ATPase [Hyphomicrobiales bacterium]